MQSQLVTMLQMQESMNARVHSDWRTQGFEWYRAIWIECAEMMDHYGWKWWKKQDCDRDQVILELIDIWHFGLSDLLQDRETSLDDIAIDLIQKMDFNESTLDFQSDLESFALQTLETKKFPVGAFNKLLQGMDLSFKDLYIAYVNKNVLNFFRQDHGYQEGTYNKQWSGREDNEHLVEITQILDCDSQRYKDDLYAELEKRYLACEKSTTTA